MVPKPVFDPLNPPTAMNPIPGHGNLPSIRLVVAMLRMTPADRRQHWDEEKLHLLEEAKALLEAALIPATIKEISISIVALMVHYPSRPMTRKEQQIAAQNWITDFSTVPADILQAACQQWRRAPNTYAPTPGQLLELADPPHKARRSWLGLVSDVLNRQQTV